MLKLLDQGVCGEEIAPNKEHEFQEGPELDCPVIACALGVFTGPNSEVEPQSDQVGDMPGFWVGGGGCCDHHGVDNDQGGGLFRIDWGILDPVSFEFSGKAIVQADVILGVWVVSRGKYAIQEVGLCNCTPCLRN